MKLSFILSEEEITFIMEERESELEARLSSLTVQLLSEQRSNNILRSEVDLLHAREKANLEVLRDLKEQLGNALVERDNLRDENNWLRFKLSDNRNIVEEEHTVTDEVFVFDLLWVTLVHQNS